MSAGWTWQKAMAKLPLASQQRKAAIQAVGKQTNAMTDERLTLAYQLAYFIHGDPIAAKRIAFTALEKLETALLAQDKRLYYAGKRHKVSMPELHLLQRLVYAE